MRRWGTSAERVDALAQVAGPAGLPVWPLMVLLVGAQAVAEELPVALAFAAQATLLAAAEALSAQPRDWWPVAAAALGYPALAFVVNRALSGEKRRLSAALAELARLKHGIDQLEDEPSDAPAPATSATHALRQVSEEGRRARQLDRATELDESLARTGAYTAHPSGWPSNRGSPRLANNRSTSPFGWQCLGPGPLDNTASTLKPERSLTTRPNWMPPAVFVSSQPCS